MHSLADDAEPTECFLCQYAGHPQQDAENGVICRRDGVLAVLNRYPYTSGHLLIAPLRHAADLGDFSDEELLALARLTRDGIKLLKATLSPQGFNVGMNLGRCAGAGLPGHLHWHVVPRWSGDNNFMPVVGDARVISESLERVAERLRTAAADLGLV